MIEVSRSALRANIRFIRSTIGNRRIISVVKSNAYGHGLACFVPLARELGINMFGVYAAEEASILLKAGVPGEEIIVMGFIHREDIPWANSRNISFYVSDLERLKEAISSGTPERPSNIHLELETGMNRTGIPPAELEAAADLLTGNPGSVRTGGTCTHLAGAENAANHMRIHRQLDTFHDGVALLRGKGVDPGILHTASSAAALVIPGARFDAVRVGIAQYGYWPSMETRMLHILSTGQSPEGFKNPLKRVISWKSTIMGITAVKPGEFVGYGNFFLTSRRQKMAAVPVGYSQGFSRSLSNLGYVLVRGRRAKVSGIVNMNGMTVDVTDCPGVSRGDEVVIIGKQGRREITVRSFGDLAGHLNYEVLAQLPDGIPRTVTA